MQKIFFLLLFLSLPFKVFATDYDSFILNFLRVTPTQNIVSLEIALDRPSSDLFESALKKGHILNFNVNVNLKRKRAFFSAKTVREYNTEYFLQYDPLTKLYSIRHGDTHRINSDANYLFDTLLENIKLDIPTHLEKKHNYLIEIDVNLLKANTQQWADKNLFFLGKDIIQPASFQYEFSY